LAGLEAGVNRGDIWTAAGGAAYAGKPRPVLIIQDDVYSETGSVAVCPLTTEQVATSFLRPPLEPSSSNGLLAASRVMVDKIAAVPRGVIGQKVGRLTAEELRAVELALLTFLGMAR
jgi:mRNA interferase MazF